MRRIGRRLALDLLVWCAVSGAFLLSYVYQHGAPADAVLPHLRLVLGLLLALACVRLLLGGLLARPAHARLAAAIAVASILGTLLAYYALVVTGLRQWGRVVSWELIETYGRQPLALAEALGIPLPLAVGAPVLAYLFLVAAAWGYLRRFDWTALSLRHAPRGVVPLVLVFGVTAVAYELAAFRAWPASAQAEPVSLTFYPGDGAWNLQGHLVDRMSAARRDAVEEAARASYRAARASHQSAPASPRRNLILIVVDSLRPDHMGVYGSARDTTPHLSRLERTGALRKLDTMHAVCSASACGILSIASSKFVHQFSSRPILLQEVLRRQGYRVHMILSGDHTRFYGLRQAYGEVDSYFDGGMAASGRYMNDDELVLERLSELPDWDGTAVMMQLHLMSAHILGRLGQAPPPPILARFRGVAGKDPAGRRHDIVDIYDYSVLRTDAIIGRALALLQSKGYLSEALVVVTADHGEALGEHGRYNHTNSVREEVLRVPLLLISYGGAPAQPVDRHAVSSQVDIAPTVLVELGLEPPATWAGEPLQQPMRRHFTFFQQHAEAGLLDHREPGEVWKYWRNTRTGEEFAFNLGLDPGEASNRLGEVPPARLREWRMRVMEGGSMATRPGTF